jgi:hypothetical protein
MAPTSQSDQCFDSSGDEDVSEFDTAAAMSTSVESVVATVALVGSFEVMRHVVVILRENI